MIRDQQLDALLAAHRNFAGASALQMAPGFVRNANFEEVGR
jgi:sigma-E factor negative regulatory protein RseA